MRLPRKLTAARTALSLALDAMGAADLSLDVAKRESDEARDFLDAARTTYGDDPTEEHERSLTLTRDGAELARLRAEGAKRKHAAAVAALADAQRQEARESLATFLPRCDRAALFAAVEGEILTIARCDGAPRVAVPLGDRVHVPVDPHVDVFAPPAPLDVFSLTERSLVTHMTKQGERDMARARAMRTIHGAIVAQHAAVDAVVLACSTLGEEVPREACKVPEAHMLSAAALEVYAATRPAFDADWFRAWFCTIAGDTLLLPSCGRLTNTVKDHLLWARAAVRMGHIGRALASVEPPIDYGPELDEEEEDERSAEADAAEDDAYADSMGDTDPDPDQDDGDDRAPLGSGLFGAQQPSYA